MYRMRANSPILNLIVNVTFVPNHDHDDDCHLHASSGFEGSFERLGAGGFVNLARARGFHGFQVAVAELEGNVSREDVQAIDELLGNHTGDRNHGDAAVVKLLEAEDVELFFRLAVAEAERVKLQVARDVAILQQEQLVGLTRVLPALLHAGGFNERDEGTDGEPERRRDLLEVVDRRTGDVRVEQEGGAFDLFADEETEGREHAHAAVGHFSLAVALEGTTIDTVAEAEDVETFRERRRGTNQTRIDRLLDARIVRALLERILLGGRHGGADHRLDGAHGDESRHCFRVFFA